MGQGRPSTYTDEIAAIICDRIASGRSLRSICMDEDMPPQRTVFGWLERNESFQQNYARAFGERAEQHFEEMLEIADEAEGCMDNAAVQAARLRVDTRKWALARMAPKRYGDRMGIEHSGSVSFAGLVKEAEEK